MKILSFSQPHAALDVYDVLSSDTNGEFKKRNPSPYKYIQLSWE